MEKFPMEIIGDINTVFHFWDKATIYVDKGEVLVHTTEFCKEGVVIKFKGMGVLHIYQTDKVSPKKMENMEYVTLECGTNRYNRESVAECIRKNFG